MRTSSHCPVCRLTDRPLVDEMLAKLSPGRVFNALSELLKLEKRNFYAYRKEFTKKELSETVTPEEDARYGEMLIAYERKQEYGVLSVENLTAHLNKHLRFSSVQKFTDVTLEDGDYLENVEIIQPVPGTPFINPQVKATLQSCTLINCEIPSTITLIDCTVKDVSFCSNLHPELPQTCEKYCKHVTMRIDELVLEGCIIAKDIVDYRDKGD